MKIKKGDTVKVISGDFKGKIGKILNFFPKQNKVQLENIGFYKKHIKSRVYKKYPKGGIIEKLKLIHVSNVMFFSSHLNRSLRIGYNIIEKDKKTREFRGKDLIQKALI